MKQLLHKLIGIVPKQSGPPDVTKGEAYRLMNESKWELSLFRYRQRQHNRKICCLYILVTCVGLLDDKPSLSNKFLLATSVVWVVGRILNSESSN